MAGALYLAWNVALRTQRTLVSVCNVTFESSMLKNSDEQQGQTPTVKIFPDNPCFFKYFFSCLHYYFFYSHIPVAAITNGTILM